MGSKVANLSSPKKTTDFYKWAVGFKCLAYGLSAQYFVGNFLMSVSQITPSPYLHLTTKRDVQSLAPSESRSEFSLSSSRNYIGGKNSVLVQVL
jgi:hypothetical protein